MCLYVKVKRADKATRKAGNKAHDRNAGGFGNKSDIVSIEEIQRYAESHLNPATGLWRETWIHQ